MRQLPQLTSSLSRDFPCLFCEPCWRQLLAASEMRMKCLRHDGTLTAAAVTTAQRQICGHEDCLIVGERSMAFCTTTEIRKKPFNLQQPHLKVSENCL